MKKYVAVTIIITALLALVTFLAPEVVLNLASLVYNTGVVLFNICLFIAKALIAFIPYAPATFAVITVLYVVARVAIALDSLSVRRAQKRLAKNAPHVQQHKATLSRAQQRDLAKQHKYAVKHALRNMK